MRYFYETEIIELPHTIDLVAIAIVSEDRREYYSVSSEFDPFRASPTYRKQVLDQLGLETNRRPRHRIAQDLRQFFGTEGVHLYSRFSSTFGYVALMWLFGDQESRPVNLPPWVHRLSDSDGTCSVSLLERARGTRDAFLNQESAKYPKGKMV